MNTPPPRPSAAPAAPAEDSIRALFVGEAAEIYDQRHATLASTDPRSWEGVAFPVEFALELAAACNLSCVMCPVPTTARPATLMNEELFRRVVDEIHDQQGYVLLPQGFGESMLHSKWADLLGYARAHGIHPIVMLTNGTLLNDKNISRVLELEIDALVISIDGVNPETYAKVRVGGDLNKVEANVRRLIAQRGEREKPKLCLRIIRMKDTAAEIDAFLERWTAILRPGDEVRINEYNDWAGKVDDRSVEGYASGAPGRGPCRMLWRNLSVHADGKVSACCHDSEDELIIGDLAAGDTISSVWHGERLARLRHLHREGRFAELPICLACKNSY